MKSLCFIIIFNTLVTGAFSQCPPEPSIPPRPQRLSTSDFRQERIDERLLWDAWFSDSGRKRRDTHTQPKSPEEVLKGLKNRVKRQGPCRTRKEYRQMTRREMNRWHRCLRRMKTSSRYDDMTLLHEGILAPAAHAGVAFLPWHRVYLWEFERRMRQIRGCRTAFVPYWDSALDSALPRERDSVLWTSAFWGNYGGTVTSGPAANWLMTPGCQARGTRLRRVIVGTADNFYTRQKILDLFVPTTFTDFVIRSFDRQPMLESAHNRHHCYYGCGGDGSHVGQLKCSPSDPVFWMLHCMVDCIWDEWSRLPGRTMIYPQPGVGGVTLDDMARRGNPANHLANTPMRPFTDNGSQIRNRDGLLARFNCPCTVRPSKNNCLIDAQCGSPRGLLFCSRDCACVSKVREGGRCDNLPDRACYCSRGTPRCVLDICQCT